MSRHEDPIRLQHMLDHAREALELSAETTKDELNESRVLQLALVRLVEVIGEAASKVSPERRLQLNAIQWGAIIGMRNRLIHGYDTIDLDILWGTVKEDLPPLVAELTRIMERMEENP